VAIRPLPGSPWASRDHWHHASPKPTFCRAHGWPKLAIWGVGSRRTSTSTPRPHATFARVSAGFSKNLRTPAASRKPIPSPAAVSLSGGLVSATLGPCMPLPRVLPADCRRSPRLRTSQQCRFRARPRAIIPRDSVAAGGPASTGRPVLGLSPGKKVSAQAWVSRQGRGANAGRKDPAAPVAR
jgi:hypothetical protein